MALEKSPINLHHVSDLVPRDPALAYRLLCLVNSPASGIHQEVHSLESALIAVGEQTFRRMATLAITETLNEGKSIEVLRMALARARFCELAARSPCAIRQNSISYACSACYPRCFKLQVPMEESISALPMRVEIREALLGDGNSERCLLCWMESSESGDWSNRDTIADEKRLDQKQLMKFAGTVDR